MVLVEESDTGVRVQLPLGWNTLLPINFDIENFVLKACEGDHKFFSAEVLLMSVGKGRCGWFYILVCGYKFHPITVYLHHIFPHLQSEAHLESS